jgi:uncharacterized protein (DUF427 family)
MDRQHLTPGPDHPITIEANGGHVVVRSGERIVADTRSALTLREATYPPVQYIPLADVDQEVLRHSGTTSYCPYKGDASYFTIATTDGEVPDAIWTYQQPYPAVDAIEGHVAFYPDRAQISLDEA